MKNKGFSLIELMVVIAIVGILAAVAAPEYSRYLKAQKISTTMGLLDSQAAASKQFYAENGRFPTVTDLGLPSQIETDPADYIAPYVSGLTLTPGELDSQGISCPNSALVVTASNFLNGAYDGNENGSVYILTYYLVVGNDGIIYQKCGSYGIEYDNGFVGMLNYNISGCPDQVSDPDSTADMMSFFASKCS